MPRLFLLASLVLILAGCASTAAQRPHPQVLNWGIAGEVDVPTLDPALVSDPTSISVASLVYGGLVGLDSRLQVVPDGASRWQVSPNGRVYTFFIRHHLRFANGRPVTASDFAAALERALGPEGASGTGTFYLNLIRGASTGRPSRGIQVVNRMTLRITLVHPASHFLVELAFPASYVPEPTLLKNPGSGWTDHAAGFGPYQVSQWQHSKVLVLRPNPYYYAGRPRLHRIRITFYQQPGDAIAAYRQGKLDLVSGLQPGTTLPATPGLQRVPALALDYIAFNTARAPFSRIEARRAFASVDTTRLAAQTMGRSAFPTGNLVPNSWNIKAQAERVPASGRALLAHVPNAGRLLIFVAPRDPQITRLAHALVQAWQAALGVHIVYRPLNASNYEFVLNKHAFDLALVRWGGDYSDPQDFLGTQLGASPDNITSWSAHHFDHLVAEADTLPAASPRRTTLYREAAAEASRRLPILPADQPAQVALIAPGLKGVSLTPLGTISAVWPRTHFAN
ncbi:MAG TPA: peptide ABC transporter substrate-binding protein [Chloroflexota bacterium]|nr:peptide ABC transporter substrate-binding protein [Chloroflexota bacterium]